MAEIPTKTGSETAIVLLQPAADFSWTSKQIQDAYRTTMSKALSHHSPSTEDAVIKRVELAVTCKDGLGAGRSALFPRFQALLASIYTLACLSAAEAKIELDFPGGLDIRAFLLDIAQPTLDATLSGPLTNITALRDAGRASGINSTHSDELSSTLSGKKSTDSMAASLHSKVAVGGTFDHLHVGHKLLLTATIFIAQPSATDREITIGITGDELLVKKKHASVLESWETRQQRSADFVESILVFHPDIQSIRTVEYLDTPGPNGKAVKITYDLHTSGAGKISINYVQISDPFGPTITDESITALVISAETRAGGEAVNDKRTEKGWAALEVFEVDVLDPGSFTHGSTETDTASSDFATKISSTEIRRRLAVTQSTQP